VEGVRFDLLDQDLSEFLLNLIARTKGDKVEGIYDGISCQYLVIERKTFMSRIYIIKNTH